MWKQEIQAILKKAVLVVEQKNIKKVNEWANEHPECYNSYNRANDIYLKLSKGATDGNEEKILTIVKKYREGNGNKQGRDDVVIIT